MENAVIPAYDIHIHTWLSPCAAREERLSSVAAYAEEARRRGVAAIGISDHFALPLSWVASWYERSGPPVVHEARRQAKAVANGVRVLVGCEADLVAPEMVTIDAEFAREVDFVLLAASHFDSKDIRKQAERPVAAAEHLVRYLRMAVELPFVDVIAHPLTVPEEGFGEPERHLPLVDDFDLAEIAAKAAAMGIAFELNGRISAREDYRRLMGRFYRIARDQGVRFTVGSDSHKAADMSRLDAVEAFARELGLERGDFLSVDEILDMHRLRLSGKAQRP